MRQHPAAVLSILNGRKQKVHVWSNPAIEGVSILTEVLRTRILDHVCVGKPAMYQYPAYFSDYFSLTLHERWHVHSTSAYRNTQALARALESVLRLRRSPRLL
jgi:hypothetical protein